MQSLQLRKVEFLTLVTKLELKRYFCAFLLLLLLLSRFSHVRLCVTP